MPPFLRFLIRRLFLMALTFLLITIALYGILMLAPVEARAQLYLPQGGRGYHMNFVEAAIRDHGLDDPYPVQYARWLGRLLRGDWGWSPSMREGVLDALMRRTPTTVELTLLSMLFYMPLGIASGVWAGWKRGRLADYGFRVTAFVATSVPIFILGLMLLSIFYVGLRWFPIGRLGVSARLAVNSPSFRTITGFLTIDGLLNGQPEISLDALRHLVLPAVTLSLAHWATLGRVTRAAIIEELDQEYMTAARGRGLSRARAVWRHALRNALLPALNSTLLSAASLITSVFVVEIIFALPGVSEPLTGASHYSSYGLTPDIAATMGFSVYVVVLTLMLMLILDLLQAIADPRLREGGAL